MVILSNDIKPLEDNSDRLFQIVVCKWWYIKLS